ncbi:hypothetical protein MVEN_01514400 [Mycena venus]|uniref:F-box domain-containing protein n=1 Tax=Mycena venus TaxID=2733690 RepID=A0A8H7CTE2_9AGAR|nr:hypothetical protein MVEN_01514400 [Mycena venus]
MRRLRSFILPPTPPEILLEIVAHNANDVPSLRAMSLVSKAMRSFAIEHLFSFVHFACAQDFSMWQSMLRRTPRLRDIVKKVKFSDPSEEWIKRHRRVRPRKPLRDAAVPPKIPILPNVRVVEWEKGEGHSIKISMATTYMALFPGTEELHLSRISSTNKSGSFGELAMLLGACGQLRVLSFFETNFSSLYSLINAVDREHYTFDLTALQELRVKECGTYDRGPDFDILVKLVEVSRPAKLKSLTFAGCFDDADRPCSILAVNKLVGLAAPSLVNVSLLFELIEQRADVEEIFSRLPTFPVLDTISIISNDRQGEWLLHALQAPKLTTLNFRILIFDGFTTQPEQFNRILPEAFPWGAPAPSEPLKSVITRKFPLIRRIGLHFCAFRRSGLHFRRGLRRRVERRFMDRLKDTGADLDEYLEVGWVDEDHNPVVYNKTNGKPTRNWKLPPGISEPETEESDCEANTDSEV